MALTLLLGNSSPDIRPVHLFPFGVRSEHDSQSREPDLNMQQQLHKMDQMINKVDQMMDQVIEEIRQIKQKQPKSMYKVSIAL